MADNSPSYWELTSNDGTNVVAVNSKTGETFSGTLVEFNSILAGVPPEDPNLLVVTDKVYHVVGTTAKLLTRPPGKSVLCMLADKGSFRYRIGDRVSAGMPTTVDPTTEVTDGSGAVKVPEGQSIIVAAAARATVKGFAATDVLTYWWL